ncbi:putative membrane protein YjfL, UPF0719 family [Chromobacterium violaceum]|uniref:DUF350 domain-containing protein n=2 Tax=Chromobacterium violaceum TaxID=536 RepID=A0A202B3P5_CHRVL|nr:DUF350 domain-containing protein [Chromobacterium violaceum]AAQ59204.1 probable transmembrane protein [Chromobacterium violaceum ATCC 12472]KJH68220.1 hypothetical protein UF16_06235 [Chromobacterium violaceum]KMN48224.1 hypothetical protein VK93_17465 [Chromobacterium violaceum]KMN84573.1 hypothetical protein VL02_19460 [Chromobacterium violaceum]KMN90562.1 hypothetical protein VL04_09630 [Chromobacterium violaceum]
MTIIDVDSFSLFALHFASGALMLLAFTWLYGRLTPYSEREAVEKGELTGVLPMLGAQVGFTAVLVTAQSVSVGYADFLVWGAVAGLAQILLFQALARAMPNLNGGKNLAASLVSAVGSLCVAALNAVSLVP